MRGTVWCVMATVLIGWLCAVDAIVLGAQTKEAAAAEKTAASVAALTIRGSLPESAGQLGLFGQIESNLAELIRRLDQAARDDDIRAVVLEIRNPTIGRGKLQELRSALQRIRRSGKRVVAELQMGQAADYLLACACDEIVMPESGSLTIPGVRAEVTYFKGFFDKLGIQADMMQVGDFKGAAEPYTRHEMSPAFRQQYEMLLDDVYGQMVEAIAADRELDPTKVRALVDVGLFTPDDALKAGLIDRVCYGDQKSGYLKESLGVDSIKWVRNYGKKKVDSDFSGMLGMMKLMDMLLGGESSQRRSSRKKIAVVYASGMIMPGSSAASLFGGEVLGSDTIVKAIREAAADKTVVALVLRVDSPGGSALASDLIWRAVRQCEKPVIASMGDVAASGGYYISMGCDRIFAEAGTLTGSIGVVGGKISLQGLYGKLGITTDVISRGKNSGLVSSESPFTDSERAVWKKMMGEVYRQFVEKAAEGRSLSIAQIEELAGGRVWTGRQAKKRGLVDETGTLRDAIVAAKRSANLSADDKVELLILPRPTNFFDQLLSGEAAIHMPVDGTASRLAPELAKLAEKAQQIVDLFREPVVLLTPHLITIR